MLSAFTRAARAARTGGSNNHPVDRRIQEVVLQPAGYTSVQRTDIVDAVEERSQVRFNGVIRLKLSYERLQLQAGRQI